MESKSPENAQIRNCWLAPKTMGPPPHVHKNLDEIMMVHEGEVHVMVGDEVTVVKAGGYHMRPHGIIHCFWNATDEPAHFTDFFCNQNFDDFFEELFFKIIPELKAQNLTIHSPEGILRRTDLDKRFDLTVFPEKRKAIVEKYGLKGVQFNLSLRTHSIVIGFNPLSNQVPAVTHLAYAQV
jgi:quercetin dioxygenase-like cupin family protein